MRGTVLEGFATFCAGCTNVPFALEAREDDVGGWEKVRADGSRDKSGIMPCGCGGRCRGLRSVQEI